jgi:hypothetical protein
MVSNRFRTIFVRGVAVALAATACLSLIASVQAYSRMGNAEETARAQLETMSANIARAADSIQTASDAILNGSTTATDAQSAIASAAATVQGASTGIGSAGSVAGFTIPFTQIRPFGNAEDGIKGQASQIATLADALSRTGTSLGTNATDLRVAAADVAGIATRLQELSHSVAQFAGDDGGLTKVADAARATVIASIFLSVLAIAMAGAFWLLAAAEPTPAAADTREVKRTQQVAAPPTGAEPSGVPPTA